MFRFAFLPALIVLADSPSSLNRAPPLKTGLNEGIVSDHVICMKKAAKPSGAVLQVE